MNKIWTLIASTMLVASVAFAQDDYDYADQAEEQYTEQEQADIQAEEQQQAVEPAEEQVAEPPEEQEQVAEETAPSKPVAAPVTQSNTQEPAQENTQNDEYAQEAPRQEGPFFGFGLKVAFDYGRMYGFKEDQDNDSDISGNPSGMGFEAGIMFRIRMIPNLYFAPEVNFAYMSTEHEYLKHKREYKSIDMELPLLMRGTIADRFYITGGPQLNFALSSNADIEAVENSIPGLDIRIASTEKIEQASFSFGIAAGFGINVVEGLFIDLRYYMGITELYPDVKTLDDLDTAEGDFSLVDMSGARMMKFKVGISYWFL